MGEKCVLVEGRVGVVRRDILLGDGRERLRLAAGTLGLEIEELLVVRLVVALREGGRTRAALGASLPRRLGAAQDRAGLRGW